MFRQRTEDSKKYPSLTITQVRGQACDLELSAGHGKSGPTTPRATRTPKRARCVPDRRQTGEIHGRSRTARHVVDLHYRCSAPSHPELLVP